ncbi:MAG: DnaJ domain-containing protein [Candidatus Sericytochromatia bacterium]
MKNYYHILGIELDANDNEIKKAFKLYAFKMHPDKHNGDKFFEERFKEINQAYETLSDIGKKRIYDLDLKRKEINNQSFVSKENALRKKEQELLLKEKQLLKREKEIKTKIEEISKKEDRIRKESNELFINKIKDNESYAHIEVTVPRSNVKKVQVKSWNKQVGDYIKKGDIIAKLQTDKKEFYDIKSNIEGFIIYTVKINDILEQGNILAIVNK